MAARRVRGPFRRRPDEVERGRALGKGVTSRRDVATGLADGGQCRRQSILSRSQVFARTDGRTDDGQTAAGVQVFLSSLLPPSKILCPDPRYLDRRTDGRNSHGWTDGIRTDGRTSGQTDGRTDARLTDSCRQSSIFVPIPMICIDGRTDGRTAAAVQTFLSRSQIFGRTDGWTDGPMDG